MPIAKSADYFRFRAYAYVPHFATLMRARFERAPSARCHFHCASAAMRRSLADTTAIGDDDAQRVGCYYYRLRGLSYEDAAFLRIIYIHNAQ